MLICGSDLMETFNQPEIWTERDVSNIIILFCNHIYLNVELVGRYLQTWYSLYRAREL